MPTTHPPCSLILAGRSRSWFVFNSANSLVVPPPFYPWIYRWILLHGSVTHPHAWPVATNEVAASLVLCIPCPVQWQAPSLFMHPRTRRWWMWIDSIRSLSKGRWWHAGGLVPQAISIFASHWRRNVEDGCWHRRGHIIIVISYNLTERQ